MIKIDKSSLTYTPLFCEENIWKLIESLKLNTEIAPLDVLFLINESNSIALFNQKKSNNKQPVIWDYHVVLSAIHNDQFIILDFDSKLEFPCDLSTYFNSTFRLDIEIPATYKTQLKPIDANLFYNSFTSNREHMRGIITESEFPEYSIINSDATHSLLTLQECRKYDFSNDAFEILSPEVYLKKLLQAPISQ